MPGCVAPQSQGFGHAPSSRLASHPPENSAPISYFVTGSKSAVATLLVTACTTLALLSARPAFAQDPVYFSNLGEAPSTKAVISSSSWIAQSFVTTGTTAAGYDLNSVELKMDAATGGPGGFSVSIFSSVGTGQTPGSSLGTLTGPNPLAAGNYSYTTPGLMLMPGTLYFLVLTSTTVSYQGAYVWSNTQDVPSSTWDVFPDYYSSSDGSSWTQNLRNGIFQFSISATPTPEPRSFAIAGLAVLYFAFRRLWAVRMKGRA